MKSFINTGSHNVDYEELEKKESLIKTKKMEDLRKVLRSHSDNFLHRMKVYSIYK